jgi:DNA-binding NarL/FixJ family response regulator
MSHTFQGPGLVGLDGGGSAIRVLIAEGEGLVRAGFRALLDGAEDLSVEAEAATGEQAIAAALELRPDVVLMDLSLPGTGGVEAARRICTEVGPGRVRVLMLIGSDSEQAVFGALRAGVTGLLLRDSASDLLDAIRVVATGEAVLAPSIARRLIADFLSQPSRVNSNPEQLEELTPREREVVGLVACGLSNHEIADRLVVSRATAKTHVSRALRKLHARDRAQLVVLAYEAGLVRPGPRWPEALRRTPLAVAAGVPLRIAA